MYRSTFTRFTFYRYVAVLHSNKLFNNKQAQARPFFTFSAGTALSFVGFKYLRQLVSINADTRIGDGNLQFVYIAAY